MGEENRVLCRDTGAVLQGCGAGAADPILSPWTWQSSTQCSCGAPLGSTSLTPSAVAAYCVRFESLFTLTWFSRNAFSPIFFQPHIKLQRNAILAFHSIFGPAILGVPIACFLMEFCTSLEHRCGYFSCRS